MICVIILNVAMWFRGRCSLKEKLTHVGQRPITIAQLEVSYSTIQAIQLTRSRLGADYI